MRPADAVRAAHRMPSPGSGWAPGPLLAVGVVALLVATLRDRRRRRPWRRGHGAGSGARRPPPAARFLRDYVDADGRVVRHDQGGDTASEGQAYALLLAVGRRRRRPLRDHLGLDPRDLQRPDGLFVALAGRPRRRRHPAADADLDIAAALALAADRLPPTVRAEARRIADAVMDHETTTVAGDGSSSSPGPGPSPTAS